MIVALVAALTALAGPGAAAAKPGKGSGPAPIASTVSGAGVLASWAEQASWVEE